MYSAVVIQSRYSFLKMKLMKEDLCIFIMIFCFLSSQNLRSLHDFSNDVLFYSLWEKETGQIRLHQRINVQLNHSVVQQRFIHTCFTLIYGNKWVCFQTVQTSSYIDKYYTTTNKFLICSFEQLELLSIICIMHFVCMQYRVHKLPKRK